MNLLVIVQKHIEAFPLALFQEQFDKKHYAWLQAEAQKYLLENKMGKYQDEIVYLWAVSEYELAKKSEWYERLAHYNQALERIQQMEKMSFTNQRFLQKVSAVKDKVNTKIEKLTKSSHGLQKN